MRSNLDGADWILLSILSSISWTVLFHQDNHLSFIRCKAGKAIAQIHGNRGESFLHVGGSIMLSLGRPGDKLVHH